MKKILQINSSVKGNDSFSIKLSDAIVKKLASVYTDIEVRSSDLAKHPLPHLGETLVNAFYTPEEARTQEQKAALHDSDQAIKAIMEADILVIGVPMYNFGIPSTLKAWIDHVTRSGVTFSYASGAPEGLVKNKKVYLAIASAGVYSEGPAQSLDFTESYLRAALGFIGFADIVTFRVEGIFTPNLKETELPKAINSINNYTFEATPAFI